jgi:hypothetical protein
MARIRSSLAVATLVIRHLRDRNRHRCGEVTLMGLLALPAM